MDIIVNNKRYTHITTSLEREGAIIYSSNTTETLANVTVLDPLATKLRYSLTFDSALKDQQALETLWNDLIVPRPEGISITMPYNQSKVSFRAKVNSVRQGYMGTINGVQTWGSISVDFEALTPFLEV